MKHLDTFNLENNFDINKVKAIEKCVGNISSYYDIYYDYGDGNL